MGADEDAAAGVADVGAVAEAADRLRARARVRLGFTALAPGAPAADGTAAGGTEVDAGPLRQVLRRHSVSTYPLVALGLLSLVDQFQAYAFTVLTPEISQALGLSVGAVAAARAVSSLTLLAAPLPAAALVQRLPVRALLCVVTGIAWSLFTAATGLVTGLTALVLLLALDGLTTGTVQALHVPLLMDHFPPGVRVRVVSAYTAVQTLGFVAAPLLVALLAGPADLTWRGVFVVLGGVSLLVALAALRLRDPGAGRWDTGRVRALVHDGTGDPGGGAAPPVPLRFGEVLRRVLLVPTLRRCVVGFMVFGVLTVPFATFLSFFLESEWGLSAGQRGLFYAFVSLVSVVALLVYGPAAERWFHRAPARMVRGAGWALAAGIVLIAAGALAPTIWGVTVLFAAGQALVLLVQPALGIAGLSVLEAPWRPHAAAVVGLAQGIGGLVGALLLTGVATRLGLVGAIASLVVPGVAGALVIASAGALIERDVDAMVDAVIEEEEVARVVSSGRRLPLLTCRGVDVSYGPLQVLFGVDLTVDEGEMVALLGTNGAGKSTLLRAVSGLSLPHRGSVRLDGREITYLDAERRLRLGISHVPGGRAVFGPLTVVDNLRGYGYALGRSSRELTAAMDRAFEAFPRLADRRGSLAGTLSGGEQQMLALAKAMMLRPRLLLIDELSLGLAPVVVADLLATVRAINAEGTAVVLVEQSVNVALSLAHHAYFMEKGTIRFDGPTAELLQRDDLLRAVFLEGADAGVQP